MQVHSNSLLLNEKPYWVQIIKKKYIPNRSKCTSLHCFGKHVEWKSNTWQASKSRRQRAKPMKSNIHRIWPSSIYQNPQYSVNNVFALEKSLNLSEIMGFNIWSDPCFKYQCPDCLGFCCCCCCYTFFFFFLVSCFGRNPVSPKVPIPAWVKKDNSENDTSCHLYARSVWEPPSALQSSWLPKLHATKTLSVWGTAAWWA